MEKLTDKELIQKLDWLKEQKRQAYIMDGSGDCGPMIEQAFAADFEATHEELAKRQLICQWCGNILCDAQLFNNVCFQCGKGPFNKEKK
ncbi:MAG: hypothetical protein M0R38_12500 [Bacteroidia bacterium]|nr:hypothetical protein [Bacteroidia bacterium]